MIAPTQGRRGKSEHPNSGVITGRIRVVAKCNREYLIAETRRSKRRFTRKKFCLVGVESALFCALEKPRESALI